MSVETRSNVLLVLKSGMTKSADVYRNKSASMLRLSVNLKSGMLPTVLASRPAPLLSSVPLAKFGITIGATVSVRE